MKVPITQEAIDAAKEAGAKLLDCRLDEVQVHISPAYTPCDHDWNTVMEPEYCLKCGMSFTRYIFTECA